LEMVCWCGPVLVFVGHGLFVDDAERFNAVLDAFVKGLPVQ